MLPPERYDELIARVLTDNATPDEKARLHLAISEDPGCRQRYTDLAEAYRSLPPRPSAPFDADAAFEKLRKRLRR